MRPRRAIVFARYYIQIVSDKSSKREEPRVGRVEARARALVLHCGDFPQLCPNWSRHLRRAIRAASLPIYTRACTRAVKGTSSPGRSSLAPRPFIPPLFFCSTRPVSSLFPGQPSCLPPANANYCQVTTARTSNESRRWTFLLDPLSLLLGIIMSLSSLGIIYRDREGGEIVPRAHVYKFIDGWFLRSVCGAPPSISETRVKIDYRATVKASGTRSKSLRLVDIHYFLCRSSFENVKLIVIVYIVELCNLIILIF